VMAAETTALSATTVVTVLGDASDAGVSAIAEAVGTNGLGAALAVQMPTLVVDIESSRKTPPAAPPGVPPAPPNTPPVGPQPLAPPVAPPRSFSPATAIVVTLSVTCSVLFCCLVAMIIRGQRSRTTSGAKSQSGTQRAPGMVAVVPGTQPGGDASTSLSRPSWKARLARTPSAAATSTTVDAGTVMSRGTSPLAMSRDDRLGAAQTTRPVQLGAHHQDARPLGLPDSQVQYPMLTDIDMDDAAYEEQLPTPQRITLAGSTKFAPARQASVGLVSAATAAQLLAAQQHVASNSSLVEEARLHAETKRAALEAAQTRLRAMQASRRTRAPVMASRFVAAAQPRRDQVLPPARNVEREDVDSKSIPPPPIEPKS